jgi:hypothetical protein
MMTNAASFQLIVSSYFFDICISKDHIFNRF